MTSQDTKIERFGLHGEDGEVSSEAILSGSKCSL